MTSEKAIKLCEMKSNQMAMNSHLSSEYLLKQAIISYSGNVPKD